MFFALQSGDIPRQKTGYGRLGEESAEGGSFSPHDDRWPISLQMKNRIRAGEEARDFTHVVSAGEQETSRAVPGR